MSRTTSRLDYLAAALGLSAALAFAACGRTPLGPKGGGGQTSCDPSCAQVCATTVDRCGSITKLPCDVHCQGYPTSPVNLCLRQLTCQSTSPSCDEVWRCQSSPQVADLTVRSYTADSPMARQLRWRVEVCNVGNGTSVPTQLALYLKRDAQPAIGDPGDVRLPIESLAPQQCKTLTHTQDGLATDRYKTWALVDSADAVVELREDNNHGGPTSVDVQGSASQLPDLRVNGLSGYIDLSNVVHYDVEICNAGLQTAYQVRLELYYNRATPPSAASTASRSRLIGAIKGSSCVRMAITGYSPYGSKSLSSWAYVDRRDEIQESVETNNIFGPVTISKGGGGKPDLVIGSAAAKVNGTSVSYSLQICNKGGERSDATNLAVYYQLYGKPNQATPPSKIQAVPEISAGGCRYVGVSAKLPQGSHNSGFYIDRDNRVAESDESNNVYYPLRVDVGGTGKQADLVIKVFNASPSPGRVDYYVQVCNVGQQSSKSTSLELFDNLPGPPSPWQKADRVQPLQALGPGQCTASKSAAQLPPGSYKAWAYVNRQGYAPESSLSNNISGPKVFTIGGSLPDLYIKELKVQPSATSASYVVTVCNSGAAVNGTTQVDLYHQTQKPTPGHAPVKTIPLYKVGSNSCATVTTTLSLGGGNYYAWAWVNRFNKPQESQTGNNIYGPRYFVVSGTVNQPDLRISAFSAKSSISGSVDYLFTICNDGQSGAASVSLALFYNRKTPPQPGDAANYTTTVPYMPPGYCSNRSAKAFLLPGSYTSYAYIDFTQKVKEKNETNNTAVTSYVVGSQGADLTIKSLAATPGASGTTRYDIEVCNEGVLAAGPTEVHLFVNRPIPPKASDIALADKAVPVPALASKSCSKLKVDATPKPGFNTSWAAVDLKNQVPEVSDNNNAKSVVVIVPTSSANVALKDFDAKPSLTGPTLYSVKACNTGTTPTPATTVRFYFDRASAPPVGTAGDQSHVVSPLLGGACVVITGFVNHNAGSYTSWALIDPTDQIKETSESDNLAGPLKVTVGAPADPCEQACKQLVSPCGLLPASQEQSCVTNCKSLPQTKIDCAGQAAQAGKCADIVTCLFT
jgi:subtilase family serine protease